MADISVFKKYAIYRIGTGVGVPTVASGVNSTDTTITSTIPFVDENGIAIAVDMLVTAKITVGENKGQIEVFKVPAGGVSIDGTTFTGCVRGIEPGGLDEAGNSDFALDLPEGTILGISMTTLQATAIADVILGTLPTGARNFRLGDGTDNDMTLYAQNADTNKPFIQYDASSNAWIISNDGTSSFTPGAGVGSISGGDGIDVTAGVISTDLATDPGLEISSTKLRAKVKSSGGITRDADGLSLDQANIKIGENAAVTATSTEINQALDGISANVTDTNLNTLTAGASSNADALHTHALAKLGGFNNTSVTVSATGTETDLFSFTVPGGTLGTGNAIEINIFVKDFAVPASGSIAFNLYYGSTIIGNVSHTVGGASISDSHGLIVGLVTANAATNSQKGTLRVNIPSTEFDIGLSKVSTVGSATEDSTANKTFKVTVDFGATGTRTITAVSAIWKIYKA